MWKDYSKGYMKHNRAAGASLIAAALIATMFLSLLCSLAYNLWVYDIENIALDEGDWQGRITGEIQESDLSVIQNDANVEHAIVNEELSGPQETVIDVYFRNARTIYQDMPLILQQLGLDEEAATYHELLLSRYFIHNPADETPPLLLAFYVTILVIMSFSLILIIRNSFELSMNARIHQFGIFSSVGATPKQIRRCLLQEAVVLCGVPMIIGCIIGVLFSFGVLETINLFAQNVSGRHEAVFKYHPMILAITLVASVCTVLVSAWIPARKLSKMTPLEAIRSNSGLQLKKRSRSGILSVVFGIEGELAGNALKAQKKSLRISTISLLLSFLGFSVMLCFTTLSDISTRYTYFERYQDAWDVMVTVKDTAISDFEMTQQLRETAGIGTVTIYQKAEEMTMISDEEQSEELIALGGLETIASNAKTAQGYKVKVQTVIMDDDSFLEYCSQLGIPQSLDGTILINQVWDSVNSNFRSREYIPFVKEDKDAITIWSDTENGQSVEVPVLAYKTEVPVLKEEYDQYTLVQFLSVSAWRNWLEPLGGAELDTYIRASSKDAPTLESLNELEERMVQLVGAEYEIESENRIREKVSNDEMIQGSTFILGGFCVLLALIGLANVFSNTLGFIRQRKREFAQYMSIGLTPAKMRKMFCIEAMVIAGKPLLITAVLTVASVQFMTSASYLDSMVFWVEAPIVPILIFAVAIVGFVALAYYIGGKRILKCDLSETLRNDAMI